MLKSQVKIIVDYLQSVVALNPVINPQSMGECIYCGTHLDEGEDHHPDCHYLEGIRLLNEFKEMQND